MHWYLFIDITLSLGFKASTCLVHFSGGKRSGLLSVFWFLHAYWTMNLSVLALVNHFPEFVQYHFLGILSCFYVVGEEYSATFTALCQKSEKKQWCFSFSETTPILAGIESLLNSWLWAGISPNYLLFPYGAQPGHAPTFPLHVRFYTEKKCGFCSRGEAKQVMVCGIRFPEYSGKEISLEIWVPKPSDSLWIQY